MLELPTLTFMTDPAANAVLQEERARAAGCLIQDDDDPYADEIADAASGHGEIVPTGLAGELLYAVVCLVAGFVDRELKLAFHDGGEEEHGYAQAEWYGGIAEGCWFEITLDSWGWACTDEIGHTLPEPVLEPPYVRTLVSAFDEPPASGSWFTRLGTLSPSMSACDDPFCQCHI